MAHSEMSRLSFISTRCDSIAQGASAQASVWLMYGNGQHWNEMTVRLREDQSCDLRCLSLLPIAIPHSGPTLRVASCLPRAKTTLASPTAQLRPMSQSDIAIASPQGHLFWTASGWNTGEIPQPIDAVTDFRRPFCRLPISHRIIPSARAGIRHESSGQQLLDTRKPCTYARKPQRLEFFQEVAVLSPDIDGQRSSIPCFNDVPTYQFSQIFRRRGRRVKADKRRAG